MKRVASACAAALIVATPLLLTPTDAGAASASSIDYRTTLNHAGYEVDTPDVRHVTSQWIQPTVECGAETSYANYLVGLARGGSLVAQVGTSADCHNGRAFYYAWTKFGDGPRAKFPYAIKAGDHLTAGVTNHHGSITAGMSDDTRGWAQGLGWIKTISTSRAAILVQARTGSAGVLPLTRSHVVFVHCKVDDQFLPSLNPKRFVLWNKHNLAKPGYFQPPGRFDVIST